MRTVKFIGLSCMVAWLLAIPPLLTVACHAPVTITTPAGKAAYTADQIVLRLNELERVAIDANAHGALNTQTTRIIVRFTVSGDKTLAASPDGGRAVVGAAWVEAKKAIPPQTNPAVQAALAAVDVVLTAFSGGR